MAVLCWEGVDTVWGKVREQQRSVTGIFHLLTVASSPGLPVPNKTGVLVSLGTRLC